MGETFLTVVLFSFMVIGIAIGHGCTAKQMKRDARKAGCIEYYLDKDNDSAWRWKTNCQPLEAK